MFTLADGFVAAGVSGGIKASGAPDLALIATADGKPVTAAAVFTTNKAAAAPVQVSRRHLTVTQGMAAAVVLNSGNANAATGPQGIDTAERTCRAVARELACDETEVLVCSTGLIGIPLDVTLIEAAVPTLASTLRTDGAQAASEAILTTDTKPKQVTIERAGFKIAGMAKGAAMLAPNMATMLAVLTTDAALDAVGLQTALTAAMSGSFHRLTVDGCTSTNDTVIVLASGKSGRPDASSFVDSLTAATHSLARQMAQDAEGATKVVTVRVTGARDHQQAAQGARAVATSQLTKCSWYGCDPYWGRVASDLGSSGIDFELNRLTVSYGGTAVARNGHAVEHDAAAVTAHMAQREIDVHADLGLGNGEHWLLTNDLTHAYVDENMGTS